MPLKDAEDLEREKKQKVIYEDAGLEKEQKEATRRHEARQAGLDEFSAWQRAASLSGGGGHEADRSNDDPNAVLLRAAQQTPQRAATLEADRSAAADPNAALLRAAHETPEREIQHGEPQKTATAEQHNDLPPDLARYQEQAAARNARVELERQGLDPYAELKAPSQEHAERQQRAEAEAQDRSQKEADYAAQYGQHAPSLADGKEITEALERAANQSNAMSKERGDRDHERDRGDELSGSGGRVHTRDDLARLSRTHNLK